MKYTEEYGRYRTAGVYKITFGDDFYIGSSMDLQKRADQHYYAMRNWKDSIKLNEAWDKYKEFNFDVIEYVDSTKPKWFLRSREQYWITQLNPTLNGCDVTGVKDEDRARRNVDAMKPIGEHRKNRKLNYSSDCKNYYGDFEYFYFHKKDVIYTIRAKVINGEYWFVAGDVAYTLGYSETAHALKQHVKSEYIYPNLIKTDRGIPARFISKNGVISFCTGSKKNGASKVKDWFVTDVLSKMDEQEG